MASAFTHAFVAVSAGMAARGKGVERRFWIASVLCSVIPDADAIGFLAGIRYEDMLGHRGLTHSLFFAAMFGLLTVCLAYRDLPFGAGRKFHLWIFFSAMTASHGLIDAMTNGGLGITFFAPFDATRYFLPWRPIQVSPINPGAFFSSWGAQAMMSELVHIWIPVLLGTALLIGIRRKQNRL